MIINAASMTSRLFPLQLIDLGFPGDPVLWYTALGILASVVGMAALRLVEARIEGVGVARRAYALACVVGVVGLVVLGPCTERAHCWMARRGQAPGSWTGRPKT